MGALSLCIILSWLSHSPSTHPRLCNHNNKLCLKARGHEAHHKPAIKKNLHTREEKPSRKNCCFMLWSTRWMYLKPVLYSYFYDLFLRSILAQAEIRINWAHSRCYRCSYLKHVIKNSKKHTTTTVTYFIDLVYHEKLHPLPSERGESAVRCCIN